MNGATLPRALALAAAGVALTAAAARADGPAPPAPSASAAAPAPPRPVEEAASALDGDAASVQALLRSARAAKKTDAAACLDRVLSRVHATARSARERAAAEDAEGERARALALRQRGKSLVLQAKRCLEAGEAPASPARSPDGVVVVRVPNLPDPAWP